MQRAAGRAVDFVFSGLNYQIEHHLFPTMPRVNFGRARAILRPFCEAHGIPYEELGLVAAYLRCSGRLTVAGERRGSRRLPE